KLKIIIDSYSICMLFFNKGGITMAKKRTHEEFLKIVADFDVLDEFEVTGKYVNNSTKIKIFHKKCNREFSIIPRDFTRRKRCSLCNKKVKLTTKEFEEHIRKIDGDKYSLLSEYISDSKKVKLKHNECGYIWNITPSHYKQGKRCPKCNGTKKKTKEVEEHIIKIDGDKYAVLSEYISDSKKVKLKHNECGYIWNITPSHYKQGKRCPKCNGTKTKTTIEFKQEIKSIIGDQYILLEEYKGANKKIKIMHNSPDCNNHIYETTPSNIKRGRGCPKCAVLSRSGENHFRYNNKLTDEDRKNNGRHSLEYKKWRDRVFHNFEYKCDCCGVEGGELNAHHLNSWN